MLPMQAAGLRCLSGSFDTATSPEPLWLLYLQSSLARVGFPRYLNPFPSQGQHIRFRRPRVIAHARPKPPYPYIPRASVPICRSADLPGRVASDMYP